MRSCWKTLEPTDNQILKRATESPRHYHSVATRTCKDTACLCGCQPALGIVFAVRAVFVGRAKGFICTSAVLSTSARGGLTEAISLQC